MTQSLLRSSAKYFPAKLPHLIVAVAFLMAQALTATGQNLRAMLISDLHLMAPELADTNALSYKKLMAASPMSPYSEDVLRRLAYTAIFNGVDVLLISGDLTKDGEPESHKLLARYLRLLRIQGIASYVIPGNHDCNNPNARAYLGDQPEPTASVDRATFRKIYNNYGGYADAWDTDSTSLSYAADIGTNLTLIAIDSNRDTDNRLQIRGDSTNVYHNDGRILPTTLHWACNQATEARLRGRKPIVMVHHHLIPHFDQEPKYLPQYMVSGHDTVTQRLMHSGVRLLLTGHLHINDIARLPGNDSIAEVATTSPLLWAQYRLLDFKGDSVHITTHFVTDGGMDINLAQASLVTIPQTTYALLNHLAHKSWPRVQRLLAKAKKYKLLFGSNFSPPSTQQQWTEMVVKNCLIPAEAIAAAVISGARYDLKGEEEFMPYLQMSVDNMLTDMHVGSLMRHILRRKIMNRIKRESRSLLMDINGFDTASPSTTDDLRVTLPI